MGKHDPGKAPLVEALERYAKLRMASFHVPGHKAGEAYRMMNLEFSQITSGLAEIGLWDATELPGLDDLHEPAGAIENAQRLAAECFGAEQTYFLVGGSTVGNLAAVLSAAGPGELLIMQRNVHKSAIHALMLSGAGAVFVQPERHPETGIAAGVMASSIEHALDKFPDAKAVFVTNPNYYGMTADLEAIARVAHQAHKPLIVDEAHGAHFGFHPRFPRSALQCGADVAIQSTHKMLPALTMGAMLHVQGDRIYQDRLWQCLRMLQSSSPSYLILGSLDLARRELHMQGGKWFEKALEAIDHFVGTTNDRENWRFPAVTSNDPMKLLLYDRFDEISGFRLSDLLAGKGIYAEMADERYVVVACSGATTKRDMRRLFESLSEINLQYPTKKKEIQRNFSNMNVPDTITFSSPVFFPFPGGNASLSTGNEIQSVTIEEAAGYLSAEMIIPYPPGIPLLFPGETITREALETIRILREQGATVQGASDRTLKTIRVRTV